MSSYCRKEPCTGWGFLEVSSKLSVLLWSAMREVLCPQFCSLRAWSFGLRPAASPISAAPSLPSPTRPSSLLGPGPTAAPVDFHVPSPKPPYLWPGLFATAGAISEGPCCQCGLPCSKAFHGSPLPAAKQPSALFRMGSGLSLTFTHYICSTYSVLLPLCHQLAWKTITNSSLGSETASLMKVLTGVPAKAAIELLGWFL